MTALLGCLSIAFARQEPRTRALSSWGWGMLAIGAGLLIAALPVSPPVALLSATGNTLVVGGVALLGRAVRDFRHDPSGDRLDWALVVGVFLLSVLLHDVLPGSDMMPAFQVRTVAVTAILGLLSLR